MNTKALHLHESYTTEDLGGRLTGVTHSLQPH